MLLQQACRYRVGRRLLVRQLTDSRNNILWAFVRVGFSPTFSTMTATNHDDQLDEIYPTMLNELNCTFGVSFSRFYRAMHFSAKRGLAIVCRPSVSDIGGL